MSNSEPQIFDEQFKAKLPIPSIADYSAGLLRQPIFYFKEGYLTDRRRRWEQWKELYGRNQTKPRYVLAGWDVAKTSATDQADGEKAALAQQAFEALEALVLDPHSPEAEEHFTELCLRNGAESFLRSQEANYETETQVAYRAGRHASALHRLANAFCENVTEALEMFVRDPGDNIIGQHPIWEDEIHARVRTSEAHRHERWLLNVRGNGGIFLRAIRETSGGAGTDKVVKCCLCGVTGRRGVGVIVWIESGMEARPGLPPKRLINQPLFQPACGECVIGLQQWQ